MSLRSFPLSMIDADVRYYPNFLAENDADALMQRLMSDLRWRQDDIKMFGRTVRIPRLQAWYGDANVDYRYSGKTLTPLPWQSDLLQLKYRCEAVTGNSFNSAQFYIDIEGHPSNSSVKMALEELGFFSKEVRILGVYKGDSNREKK